MYTTREESTKFKEIVKVASPDKFVPTQTQCQRNNVANEESLAKLTA
jgi:hypothetical protein